MREKDEDFERPDNSWAKAFFDNPMHGYRCQRKDCMPWSSQNKFIVDEDDFYRLPSQVRFICNTCMEPIWLGDKRLIIEAAA